MATDFAIQKLDVATDGILSFAVEKLGEFIGARVANPDVVQSNAEFLCGELGFMKSFLKDAEKNTEGDHRVRHWVSEVKKIAEETVSVLDDFNNKMGEGDPTLLERLRSLFIKTPDIGDQLESLKARVEELAKRKKSYGISNINSSTSTSGTAAMMKTLRRTTSYMDADQLFIGHDDAKKLLVDELLKQDPHRCVVSIYGTGGSGKTSLARTIYNSPDIVSNFPCRAWTYVSQEYTVKQILRRVISSLNKDCNDDDDDLLDKMNEEVLERRLRKLLKDSKYLVVVDDVWDRKAWESLKRAFPNQSNGSRVIVTTRKKDVATRIDGRIFAHHLRALNPKESWELFIKKVCQGDLGACWSPDTEDLGKEMVAKCEGLPLAIVVLGGWLAHKQSDEWQNVKEKIWSHLINDSFDDVSDLLSLSYDDLSKELKHCFLYIGMFPEDYTVNVRILKYFWMAEEFIVSQEGNTEEIAETYLNELISRNLIQAAELLMGEMSHLRIHDLLRSLAMKKAFEMDFFYIYNPSAKKHSFHRMRHVIHDEFQRYLSTTFLNAKLRSLIMINIDLQKQFASVDLVAKLGVYNQLYVLCLELGETQNEVLEVIGSLTRLKMLLLITNTSIIHLPPSIKSLVLLQTLVVWKKGGVAWNSGQCSLHLPTEISELKNLRFLVSNNIEGNVAGVGALSNLRTLYSIEYEHWVVIPTHKLVKLQELEVKNIKEQIGKVYSLESIVMLTSLHTLSLSCSDQDFPPLDFLSSLQNLRRLVLTGKMKKLPSLDKWPRFIKTLGLIGLEVEEDPIPMLERLPNLKRLELGDSTWKSPTLSISPQTFLQLEVLGLDRLSMLKKLDLGSGALPIIKCLYISDSEELKNSIPEKLKPILIIGPSTFSI